MIATLEGILEHCGIGSVVIKVGGVGIQVYVPSLTLSRLGVIGDKVSLYTHLYVKEDNISLYGFASSEEVALFKNLISISGIGPRIALALLSKLSAEQLATAIISGNVALIDQVPGIGKKIANRLVVELRDKLEREWKEAALPLAPEDSDAIAALTSLGYSLREVIQVVSSIPNSSELSLEEKVKTALQELASK
ncbi:MAG: Holliday junction branch migration protein RuvA [Chloroflexi bacterium CG15_BIG_FIL_POST_REV_8_21_14_020_46_15]|jgi:Holliday junction DNA helicase RuvA|nr:MAG: Holliday junction DNA helicase RuvA [Dehalococcoidia bacterium CG2_30_46_19]PIW40614.1 MAG: Holliday junction branch migration protein RuvA [Chloroflexi bacterium CG15_BIG_FIL_POST_REV_8_21_14_020_46_15]